jgi:hypothetical protein
MATAKGRSVVEQGGSAVRYSLGTSRNRSELFFKYRRQARGAERPFTAAPGTDEAGYVLWLNVCE